VNDNHTDILWLQLVDSKITKYVAVVYSKPDDTVGHKKIMAALRLNYAELSPAGNVVIMGDFNAKITRITAGTVSNYGPYENSLMDLLSATGLAPLTASRRAVKRNEHWTYLGRNGGRSVNDYILVEEGLSQGAIYMVHQHINLQSGHRLMTATLAITHTKEAVGWGVDDQLRYKWDVEGARTYTHMAAEAYARSGIETLLNNETPTHNTVGKLAAMLTNVFFFSERENLLKHKGKFPVWE
jgi:hypothetical protein